MKWYLFLPEGDRLKLGYITGIEGVEQIYDPLLVRLPQRVKDGMRQQLSKVINTITYK